LLLQLVGPIARCGLRFGVHFDRTLETASMEILISLLEYRNWVLGKIV